MKKLFLASLLALPGLAINHGQASAICFECFKPCISIPLPRIPVVIPKVCFPCANCCHQCPPPGVTPWYLQYPSPDASAQNMDCGGCNHCAKLKALHSKVRAHFTCKPAAVAASGGFSSPYQMPYTGPMGYAGGYPSNYPAAPSYWYAR